MRARAGTRHSVVHRSRTDVHGPYFKAAASLRKVRTRDGLDCAVSRRSVDVMSLRVVSSVNCGVCVCV